MSALLLYPVLALRLVMMLPSLLAATTGNTTDILHSKEVLVERLAEAAAEAYHDRCTVPCPECVLSACSSPKPPRTTNCSPLFGSTEVSEGPCTYRCSLRKLDYTLANILTSSQEEEAGVEVAQERCWTSPLDQKFVRNHRDPKNGPDLRWQYFASNNGLTRLYPAHTLRTCHVLDPRIRPWYVAATSGPKNVLLLLDVSASMLNYGRLGLALSAAVTVIQTLTNVDYTAVLLFSDSARQLLLPDQPPGTLLRASYSNISRLSEAMMTQVSADPAGGTNYEAALLEAFDVLDLNQGGPDSANCSTALLFLTDGFPNQGSTSQDFLIELVRRRNAPHQATVFTYTLGSNSGAALAQGIACETGGVYTHIGDGGKLRRQLSLYYDYFALLRQTDDIHVAWVEPYEDAVGAGLLVTASKAVYDTRVTPPRLVGVVGMDVLVSDLRRAFEETGLDYQDVINFLASRNLCPAIRRFNESILDQIRVQGGGEPCGVSGSLARERGREKVMAAEGECSNATAGYCGFEYRRYETDPDHYREESCCFGAANFSVGENVTLLSCDAISSFHSGPKVLSVAILLLLLQ